MKEMILMIGVLISMGCHFMQNNKVIKSDKDVIPFDSHVHLMSPALVNYWKELGIPFSRPAHFYTDIDSILHYNQTSRIHLIGMAYVYGNPEYYQGDDGFERMKMENNYLISASKKHQKRVKPFFAVDPLKDYAIQEIKRCYHLVKDSGLKLHFNASQVYLTVPEQLNKIKQVFIVASELNLPIILHFDNWHPKFGKPDITLLVDSILTGIPSVKLQIAHLGTSGGFNHKTRRFIDAYLELKNASRIPDKHQIVFDISAVALDKDSEGISQLTEEEFIDLKTYIHKIGIKNIVFGTDYPLYNSQDYYRVLKDKVGLSAEELQQICK